ncbi:MAG: NADH-quinone oxidoreductase subunit NuoE [Ruminococcaceae bacterium]|nr:NADH-quinone oxidoreductase subunit NuoE [Oscillospiraceae bacterium]
MCNSNKIQSDLKKLEPVLAAHAGEFGSLITVLQEAQEIYGYLPDDVLAHIAVSTGDTVAHVRGVATFYAQFRFEPVGKYLIQVCCGTACHVNRSQALIETLETELGLTDGHTTEDGLFTLSEVACLGCCSLSPVITVNGEVHSAMTPEKLRELIKKLK